MEAMSTRARLLAAGGGIALAASLGLGAASPAAAAQGCGGRFLQGYVYGNGYAQVDVYLENGTTNCLVNRTRGASWGNARWMEVEVKRGRTAPWGCVYGASYRSRTKDCGSYRYYAGPVRVYAPNSCISFEAGFIKSNGARDYQRWNAKHCN